jgi:low temperature requirement protein LtrA
VGHAAGALMSDTPARHRGVTRRGDASVSTLELFFDLVFVLAITQCTALMAAQPTWAGLARGLMVLAVLWWAWVGYAWLTSVIDPEEDAVRLAIFVAMAALLVVSICVPEAFGDLGLAFAIAYAVVRFGQIVLFVLASPDDPQLRRSVLGLAASSTVAVAILVTASFLDGVAQGVLWALAIVLDFGGPLLFGSDGWKLVPGHFAERHGLIIIIALGESIVAIGVAADDAGVDAPVVGVAVIGVFLAATLWWTYFDVSAVAAERHLSEAPVGKVQNELARDGYSLLHLVMVAGVVLVALGLKKTVAHVTDPLHVEIAVALCGGAALYLLGHVLFRWRMTHTVARERLAVAVLLAALVPIGTAAPAWVTLLVVTTVMALLVAYETTAWAETRDRIRHHGADGS